MSRFLRSALTAGVIVGGFVVAYRYLLDDGARSQVSSLCATTKDFVTKMSSQVCQGVPSSESAQETERNQAWVASQWESLGY
jgi:hypothetical protein